MVSWFLKQIFIQQSLLFCTHGHDHTNYDLKEIMTCDDVIRKLTKKGNCDESGLACRLAFLIGQTDNF